jgi:hypothetical protein
VCEKSAGYKPAAQQNIILRYGARRELATK